MAPKIKLTGKKLDTEINIFEPGKIVTGVDIGAQSVKIAVIKESPAGARLLGIGMAEIAAGAAGEDRIAAVKAAVLAALKQIPGKPKALVTLLQAPSLTIKNLSLPAMPAEELRESVKWELEQNITFAIDQACIDFIKSGETVRAGAKNFDIEAVAMTREDVQEHLRVFVENNLPVSGVMVPALSLWNVFQKGNKWKEDDTIALIDVGALTTKITIYARNALRFTREVFIGADAITQALAQDTGLSMDEAEAAKCAQGLKEDGPYYVQTSAAVEQLAAELDRSFGFYKAQYHIEKIDRLVLYGGGASMIALDKFLTEKLGVFCEVGNPFDGILFAKDAYANFDEIKNFFAMAVGAALSGGAAKRVNLLPAELRRERTVDLKKIALRIVPAVLLVVLGGLFWWVIREERRLAAAQAQQELVIAAWKEQQQVRKKLRFFESTQAARAQTQAILEGISEKIPEGVYLNFIDFTAANNTVILDGEGSSNHRVIEFVKNLETIPAVVGVKVKSVEGAAKGGQVVVDFRITILKK
ncbi:MAG: type IV pilus assembly protein PilM [Candidatus Omnitrophica bacterium]|nr:type IV pilus assembly protein PilM [Candidatus Omnitrophota bacterium]